MQKQVAILISTQDGKDYITIMNWQGRGVDAVFEITLLNKYNMRWYRDIIYMSNGNSIREINTADFKHQLS